VVLTNTSNVEKQCHSRSREGWINHPLDGQSLMMSGKGVRILHSGVPHAMDGKRVAVALVLVMLLPIFSPVNADSGVGRDDFGVLESMADALLKQRNSGEAEYANATAEAVLSALESKGRPISEGDALLATDGIIGNITMRDTQPLEPDHPRPYVYLNDPNTHPAGWPNDLVDTLFELPPTWTDPLAFGANTYSLYVNYTSRNNGPQYEAWDYGTFTGDILTFQNVGLFENAIDIDGDGSSDIAVGLSIVGLGNQGEGWGVVWGDGLIPTIDSIWVRPNFQWRVRALDLNDPMWDSMATMEVAMMKGVAYDLNVFSGSGESYALVIDSRFTQPPNDFQVRVGLDQMTLDVAGTLTSILDLINIFNSADNSAFELTGVSAPYAILISNPDADSSNLQTDCSDSSWYDPEIHHDATSREHRCGYNIGIGYVHFEEKDETTGERPVEEFGYIDVGLHPREGDTKLPSEADLVIRNDNTGDNSFDNIELFSDTDSDLFFHYFEDRSNHLEEGGKYGNITDSRGWIRDLPKGTLPTDEIEAIFTMIGEAPGSVNFPGQMPNRLSLIVSIKNFTADNSDNVNDNSLILNPSDERWNSLILIAGTERIAKLEYVSTFQRHAYEGDSSSLQVLIEDLPEVVAILGTFEIPSSNRVRVQFGTAPDLLSEVLDNVVLNLVEIILDLGTILNGLPEAIVGTAGDSSGEIILQCYNQVKQTWSDGSSRVAETTAYVSAAIASSPQPIYNGDHILLGEDLDNSQVDGRYVTGDDPLVPIGMSVAISDISGFAYSYDQDTDLRTISLNGQSDNSLVIGHLAHNSNTTSGEIKQFATISNRPSNLTISQQGTDISYDASSDIGTITYSGEGEGQYNALRLIDLPSKFELQLGDELGFQAEGGVGAIEVQISNASIPLTMDGDHARFWVDQNSAEASMSLRISNLTNVQLFPPDEPGANGPTGNSKLLMNRSQSSQFGILLEDLSVRDDEFLGMNGRIFLDPLPRNVEFSIPTSNKSSIIQVPEFGEKEGILSLSFFLSGMIDFGTSINEFAIQSMVNLGDASDIATNMSLGLDLVTGEEFDLTLDVSKGVNLPTKPEWAHGLSAEVFEATELVYNYSRMPSFTQSSRELVAEVLEDWKLTETEKIDLNNVFSWSGINESKALVDALEDGFISKRESVLLDLDQLENEGITLDQRRSWHSRVWMPDLPPGKIELYYEVTFNETLVPTFEILAAMDNWTPSREVLTVMVKGLQRSDNMLKVTGLDTSVARDISLHMSVSSQSDLIIPRTTIDMTYDMGERMETAHVMQNNRLRGIRTELILFDAPNSTDLFSRIGDILQADLVVPPEHRIGQNAADSLMLQQLRKVDDKWWPSTLYLRDVPGEMHLLAAPDDNFDIHEVTSFQGMFELQYSSNSDQMDMFVETKGKSQNIRADNLMLAENLPDRFSMVVTEDYGASISASGNGVEKLYMRRSNNPMRPGVELVSAEVIGEDLKSADVHIRKPLGYPVVVIDGITGGRIVATGYAEAEVSGFDIDGRAVLLDAQFTGLIPTASSIGVNGLVTDLSLIGGLTGGKVETTHIIIGEPISTIAATTLTGVFG
jgi:hypothetical protein